MSNCCAWAALSKTCTPIVEPHRGCAVAVVAQVLHPDTLTQADQDLALKQARAQAAKAQTQAAAWEETPYRVSGQCCSERDSMLARK